MGKIMGTRTAVVKRLSAVAAATALGAAVLASPGVAHAQSSYCSVNGWLNPIITSCTTDAVRAHANGWIDVGVYPYSGCRADFYIWDARNQEIIYRATGVSNFSTRLFRVYSWYHLKATFRGTRCGGEAGLDNE